MFAQPVQRAPELRVRCALQKEIVGLLEPITTAKLHYQDQFFFIEKLVGSALDVWIDKEKLTMTKDLTVAAEILVEILLEIKLRPDQLIKATFAYIKKL